LEEAKFTQIVWFIPAVLAAVTDVFTAGLVLAHQPDYPDRFVVYQVVMLGAALLAAVPKMWVRVVGFVILLAGVLISMAVGLLYVPTAIAAGWVMVRTDNATRPGE
jgi:hypothetical protein